jgi:2-dehydro-3-deoxyglucarate aldolase
MPVCGANILKRNHPMENRLKEQLARGKKTVGGWLTVASPVVAEATASCGFDWVAVDMEHAPVSEGDLQGVFIAIERSGAAPMVRLPEADPYLARRLLDAGAHGLIIPVVESAHAFSAFSRHCLYPPAGSRGVGLSRCNLWGDAFDEYIDGFSPVLVPQIESAAGVAASADIAALAEVDALFLGPYDLSASLGNRGDFSSTAFRDAISTVRETCLAHGKAAGIHQVEPDPVALRARIDEGFGFVAYGTDMIAMRVALKLPESLR